MGEPRPAAHLVTIAGTNGKGSTTHYISAMLRAAGFRVGTYTSPHLFRYNERVQLDGREASDEALIEAFERVEAARGDISLTYFEFGTLAAFDLMARSGLDYACLEVGLGGRLDAVNILDTDCAVITPIGLDHQEYLGPDRESIGREKAGIIRPGKPVICGEHDPPETVLETAELLGASVARLGREFTVSVTGESVDWEWGSRRIRLAAPAMKGPHQIGNMATALAAVCCLRPEILDRVDRIEAGLQSVRLPGRLQQSPHCPRVWIDVGHNPHAAQAVSQALDALDLRVRIAVLGMLRDKDAGGVISALTDQVQEWFCAGLGGDRGRTGGALAQEASRHLQSTPRDFDDVESALATALKQTRENEVILVIGSFNTAAQAAAFLAANC